jgi:hypothetical protein
MLAKIPIIAMTTKSSIRVKILVELAFALRAMVGEASDSINVKRGRIIIRTKCKKNDIIRSFNEIFFS